MPHNTRSPQQWEIISQHIDFWDKTVLDLGCGYGDILLECYKAGATICGLDSDLEVLEKTAARLRENNISEDDGFLIFTDIDNGLDDNTYSDIIICFSVLPYLKQPFMVLEWIREHSKQALIECQYSGDGPGSELIKNDNDMQAFLSSVGWQSVKVIGKTLVKDRNKYRSIWLCE